MYLIDFMNLLSNIFTKYVQRLGNTVHHVYLKKSIGISRSAPERTYNSDIKNKLLFDQNKYIFIQNIKNA